MSATTMPIDVTRLMPAALAPQAKPSVGRANVPSVAARAIESIGITVANLDRAVRFYSEVLTFVEVGRAVWDRSELATLTGLAAPGARVARLRLGEELLELTEYTRPLGRLSPPDTRSNDRWFQHIAIVVTDMAEAYDRLVAHGARAISVAPQRLPDWNPSAGGIEAFYFLDPDGHPLELIQFPSAKGHPRWHRSSGRLFLGIDHTAIVVAETEASLSFYRDVLGMEVVGRSENFGAEQERLNRVRGCRVRITTLAAESGLKIELLDYVTPTDGRPMPTDERANDLVHWETAVRVSDIAGAIDAVHRAGRELVSVDITNVRSRVGPARGFLARDPDGHVMRFVAPT
jgi:catechol 2,3-dioxygenase-like lactoylglutathione lyase family enzyme